MTPKIIELLIEDNDEQAGLDGIALVNMPAHEAAFEYFSLDKDTEETCSHYVLSDEQIPQVLQMFHAFGEPQGFLETEGFKITKVKRMGKKEFAILADPNGPSSQDTPDVKFRYKYVGPQDDKNRTFCAEMMRANRVFRIEDIDEMSRLDVNSVGPDGYSIFEWRGSYNCRHRWVQLMYEQDTTIVNKASVRKGLLEEDDVPGPDTLTTSAREAGYAPRVGFSTENPNVSSLSPYVDQVTKDVERKPVLTDDLGVKCEECGWEWNYKDGGEKPYMCNKCGYDNLPTQMSSTETTFSVFNAEQRLVVGPAMIPDKMIIRRNEITGEIYYVYFSPETIKKLQQKFMKEKLLDKTNLEHGRKFLKDVDVVESWIVEDPERDKQQVFGMDYPAGTWMIIMKVTDDDTWEKVKDGKLKGFSVQGYFLEKAKFNHINNDLIEEIKSILKQVK